MWCVKNMGFVTRTWRRACHVGTFQKCCWQYRLVEQRLSVAGVLLALCGAEFLFAWVALHLTGHLPPRPSLHCDVQTSLPHCTRSALLGN